jgi:hypothetical protein
MRLRGDSGTSDRIRSASGVFACTPGGTGYIWKRRLPECR